MVARGSDASVAGGGVRSSQTPPAHTTTVATDAAANRATPNHSIQARARSAGERGGTGLDNGSTIDLPDQAHDAPHHQEGAGDGDATAGLRQDSLR
jgi:Tfp pilus assembly major pilin PilA